MRIEKSKELYQRAQHFIPGGVNSPVRAFKAVGGDPLFIERAEGAYVFDADGNRYIELINSWGPMILGHAYPDINDAVRAAIEGSLSFGAPTEKEVEIAELITQMVPSVEKVRMVNSGTEATMSAVRLARGYTGKNKIIKFDGCYHGHGDSFLIAAGSGAMTMGTPDSPGVTPGTAQDTLIAQFNDLVSVEQLTVQHEDIAAVIVEPVAGNMGCVLPEPGFLEGLRKLCDEKDIVLIFDEVMTGFRLAPGGAQECLNVIPDMTTLGKIIGGGMPVGAYGGKSEIMDFVSPKGPVYQAGTLSGNPVAMAAGLAVLTHLRENPSVYERIGETTREIHEGLSGICREIGRSYTINRIGSMISLFFTEEPVCDMASAKKSDTEMFGRYFRGMLENQVYLAPSQFESLFISSALSGSDVDQFLTSARQVLKALH